ncbi:hypothetical protein [Chryseobacterium sp. FH1]|uniref:hypothetical protein n=1 Tax=Chryseobacterium sp. FH1 TaxID=1233951 RepID=UPI0004E36235|nr:hypothetical protein [Chryseobacterium sp. FH1]KFC21737.1 hypothetical protein IO90_07230 [Chryseobacterium sp. FH1]
MKKIILFFIVLCFAETISGQEKNFFIIQESEVYSLFNFMQTASKKQGTSSTYQKYIDSKLGSNEDFKKLIKDFKSIDYNVGIVRQDYPQTRKNRRSYLDLLIPNAVKSKDVDDFNERITGILPVSEQLKIYRTLKSALPYFKQYVWNDSEPKIKKQVKELEKYNDLSSDLFIRFNRFYKSSWDTEIPFYVALYPIPGKIGTTTAVPHGNALCVGSMVESTDVKGSLGVTLHEMCHILYHEQSIEVQTELEKYFKESKSKYAKLAYSYFNEAMATALGNGYAYKVVNKGVLDKEIWYNNPTIDLFAKAIYPLTEQYLNENKSIDKRFIDQVIDKFAETFPDCIYEYAPNFNTVNIYTDQLDGNFIFDNFFEYFEANSVGISSPMKNVSQSPKLLDDDSSFIILLDNDQKENLNELKKAFPEIRKINYEKSMQNISFIDCKGRMIIILFINKKEDLGPAFEKLEKHKKLDINKLIQY